MSWYGLMSHNFDDMHVSIGGGGGEGVMSIPRIDRRCYYCRMV